MSHALVVGKFYPPHIGHHKLIDTAVAECDFVTVAVCYSSVENINVDDRVAWLKEEHPSAHFIKVSDDTPVLYTDETWELWLDCLMDSLYWQGRVSVPDVIYSGESYAEEFARRLEKRYEAWGTVSVGVRMLDRMELPVSASMFRHNPAAAWDLLRPAAKAGLCKRVVICGAESSGTTTLATALADRYDCPVVPEWGRFFTEAVGLNHNWTPDDFIDIAGTQSVIEHDLARVSRNGLLICDTDFMATAMFSQVYLGSEVPQIRKQFKSQADLYIVTGHKSVPFEQDGWRENERKRNAMWEWFASQLGFGTLDVPVVFVDGEHEGRLRAAMYHINTMLMNWGIEEPLEYREQTTLHQ